MFYGITWTLCGFAFPIAVLLSKGSLFEQLKRVDRSDKIALMVFWLVAFYTGIFVSVSAPNFWLVVVGTLMALCIGLAAAQATHLQGIKFQQAVYIAIFAGIIAHIPAYVWLMVLESDNAEFVWSQQIPSFLNIRHYGFALEAGICCGLGLFLTSNDTRLKLLIAVGITSLWAMLFWSGGRGAILAIVASFAVSSIIVPVIFKKLWKAFAATTLVGAGVSLLIWTPPNPSFGLFQSSARTFAANSVEHFSSSRMSMWTEAMTLFLDKPIFGYGLSQYAMWERTPDETIYLHTHNFIVDALFSLGIVGAACVFFLVLKSWWRIVSGIRQSFTPYQTAALLGLNSLYAHSLISGPYYFLHSRIYIALFLGILLVTVARPKTEA